MWGKKVVCVWDLNICAWWSGATEPVQSVREVRRADREEEKQRGVPTR